MAKGPGPRAAWQISNMQLPNWAICPRNRCALIQPQVWASTRAAAISRLCRAAASSLSASPSHARANWSGDLRCAFRCKVRYRPTAPPNQQAATPIPPHAKPARRRYQSVPPTSTAGTRSRCTGALSICARPMLAHFPFSGCTPGMRKFTAKACHPSGTWAVMMAWSTSPAKEHHALVPLSQ